MQKIFLSQTLSIESQVNIYVFKKQTWIENVLTEKCMLKIALIPIKNTDIRYVLQYAERYHMKHYLSQFLYIAIKIIIIHGR